MSGVYTGSMRRRHPLKVPSGGGRSDPAGRRGAVVPALILSLGMVILLGGCASANYNTVRYDPALLDGASVFGEPVDAAPAIDPLWVSPAMREFVDVKSLRRMSSYARFRVLMKKLMDHRYFVDQYEPNATYTAAETFEQRKGNCVAYTNMFVAIAREAGLEAEFQLVTGRPVWNVESGYLIKNNHINVLMKNMSMPGLMDNEMTVDFNSVNSEEDARRRRISDAHANSLFYANIAIDHLHARDYSTSFAYMKRAIHTAPTNHDLWNNLGVLYSVLQAPVLAEQSYRTALRLDGDNKTAIAGVAKSLEQQGRLQEAQKYAELAKRYQRRNPYYHFAVAQQAFHNSAYEEALKAINEAIDIKKRSAFYALRAAAAEQLGDDLLTKESLRLQHKYRNRRDRVDNPQMERYRFN